MEQKVIDHIDIHVSATWGVHWDEMKTARDFLQNFYDANKVNDIKVQVDEKTVQVYGPEKFDYKNLLYVRSTKTNNPDTIGKYGEGFKASLLNAMRNWNCSVEMYVGNKKLRFYFKDMEFDDSEDKIIICELSEIDPIPGTRLVVGNCNPRLITEFKFGLKHFYYEQNPLFGECLINDPYDDIQIYKSTDEKCGYLFYGKLIRAKLNLPIVIVCLKKYQRIDDKIKFDRDREAFTQELKESLLKYLFTTIKYLDLDAFLLHIRDFWVKGDNELAIIAETRRNWYQETPVNKIFPNNYYAKERYLQYTDSDNLLVNPQIREVVDEFNNSAFHCCPRYMSKFGMKTPDSVARQKINERQKNISNLYSRGLNLFEKQGIDILADFIRKLSPELYKNYRNALYTVGENDEVIGELKKKKDYKDQHVFLNKIFFTFSFHNAIAILLHEWAHLYGHDGGRSFSDALTGFIALILKKENILEDLKGYVNMWNEISMKIQGERKEIILNDNVEELFENLPKEKMKEILMSIPQEECLKLLKMNGVL